MQIRDPETHEVFGTVLTTNPDLWVEWEVPGYEPEREIRTVEPDHNWAELFGYGEE
jgi:hypothetical protein